MFASEKHLALRFTAILLCVALLIPPPGPQAVAQHPVRAKSGMVVSSHYLASQVGVDILKKGGNAVDAAIATGFALAVALPGAGNIGGGGFMLVRLANGETHAFDFREKAPAAASAGMYLDSKGEYSKPTNHEGYLSVGVPGTVAGFYLAHGKLGKLPMKDLLAPAIRLAQKGIPVTWTMADDFRRNADSFRKYPGTARAFLKNGEPYVQGATWRQPDLAKTLVRIQKKGRDGFYKGETARLLAADMKKHGGLVTEADLAAYEAKARTALKGKYRGFEIIGMPPVSSGGTALIEMLNILEGYDVGGAGFGSARHFHLLAESMRRAFADRAKYLGDPDFNPDLAANVAMLTSKEHAAALRQGINETRASASDPATVTERAEADHTTHYSVIDKDGNAVVVTYTLEGWYGSHIVAEGTGFLLNNEMGDFNPQPGRTDATGLIGTPPNVVAPGKRMLSSMTPAIIVSEGKPYLLIGSPGGRTIINTVLQVVVNVLDFKMDIAEAIAAPRIHHQWLPDRIDLERNATSPDSLKLLESYGHKLRILNSSRSQGRAMGILVDSKSNLRTGASDPRDGDGAAVGY